MTNRAGRRRQHRRHKARRVGRRVRMIADNINRSLDDHATRFAHTLRDWPQARLDLPDTRPMPRDEAREWSEPF